MLKIHSFLQRMKKPIAKFLPPGIGKYKMHAGVIVYMMATILFILSPDYVYDANKQPETHAKAEMISLAVEEMVEETANEAVIRTRQNEQGNLKLMSAGETTYYSTTQILANSKNTQANSLQTGAAAKVDNGSTNEEKELNTKELNEKAADKKNDDKKNDDKKTADKKTADKTKEKQTKKRVIDLSDSDIKILQRIVEAEATGENVKGKILVANVILNRVEDDTFPDTVEGVVFQKDGSTYQFSPIKDNRYWSVDISKDTITAVNRALEGEDYSQGALYFSARSKADKNSMSWFDRNLDFLFEYGGHEFFK